MDEKLRLKIRKALADGFLTPAQLSRVLTFRTKKNLQKFMDTVNAMYSNDEILPVTFEEEKYLMLVRR